VRSPWWKSAVIYQIYPRSFCDTTGDGVGDLGGIEAHLDHVAGLGADAIWLSPIFPSPMADFGYDVSDYCGVDPVFGTLATADALIDAAHRRGLRILLDWVPNHTSDRHPWFVDARSSRNAAHRDWYVWRDGGGPDEPPNGWLATFGGRAWTWDETTSQWYLHLFLAEQPDLDWRNPEVVDAMHATLRFWLDRGIDGFRMDVVHAIGKDPDQPVRDEEHRRHPVTASDEAPYTHELLRGIRRLLDGYPGDRMSVGEVFILDPASVARFYGDNDELHLAFYFTPMLGPWEAGAWRTAIDDVVKHFDPRGAWPTWVLSNHDNRRHRTRYGSEGRARAAAVLLLTLRGTPFLYAGEELGLEDAVIPENRKVDPGGRDGCRAPLPWDSSPNHGWAPGADPWLPWPPHPETANVATEDADPGSMLNLYRRLLAARRSSAALTSGSFRWLPSPEGVLAWRRDGEDGDERAVAVNFTSKPQPVPLTGSWTVDVASDGRNEGTVWADTLGPDQAVVLRAARPERPLSPRTA
jgi:alpha-glucosidase